MDEIKKCGVWKYHAAAIFCHFCLISLLVVYEHPVNVNCLIHVLAINSVY